MNTIIVYYICTFTFHDLTCQKQTTYNKPVLDLNYSMAVATLQAPTRLHQSCKHLTSHLMAHHEELLGPSTQANDTQEK
jgi:hypothetical protein